MSVNNNDSLPPGMHRTTTHDNGTIIVKSGRFHNGVSYDVASDLDEPEGLAVKSISAENGEETIHFVNGASISTDPAHMKHIRREHGQLIAVHPNGDRAIQFNDGTHVYYRQGSTRIVYRDGSERHLQSINGKLVLSRDPLRGPAVINADGSVAYYVDGREVSPPLEHGFH